MAMAIKEFNEYVIKDERVEVIALPFRDGVNIVQRRCDLNNACVFANGIYTTAVYTLEFSLFAVHVQLVHQFAPSTCLWPTQLRAAAKALLIKQSLQAAQW